MDLIRFTHPSPLRLRDSLSVTPTRDRRGESVLNGCLQVCLLGFGWWMLQIQGPEPVVCSTLFGVEPCRQSLAGPLMSSGIPEGCQRVGAVDPGLDLSIQHPCWGCSQTGPEDQRVSTRWC